MVNEVCGVSVGSRPSSSKSGRLQALPGQVVQGHVHRRLRRRLPGHGRSPRRHREQPRIAEARRHLVHGARGGVAVFAVAQDRRRLPEADAALRLRFHEQVVPHVGGSARDPEHVAETQVQRMMSQDGMHARRLYGRGLTCPSDCPMMAGSRGGSLTESQGRARTRISGTVVALVLALASAAAAEAPARQAVVLGTAENMYSAPHPDKDVVSQALLGQVVGVLESRDGYLRVETPDRYAGWIPAAAPLRVLRRQGAPLRRARHRSPR